MRTMSEETPPVSGSTSKPALTSIPASLKRRGNKASQLCNSIPSPACGSFALAITQGPRGAGVSSVWEGVLGRLEGKVAFMTAAAAGIGGGAARAFAREGARVIATDRDKTAIDALGAELKRLYPEAGHETYALDVTDHEALRSAAARHTGVNVLYNGAGWVHQGMLLTTELEDWQRSFDINVTPMFV